MLEQIVKLTHQWHGGLNKVWAWTVIKPTLGQSLCLLERLFYDNYNLNAFFEFIPLLRHIHTRQTQNIYLAFVQQRRWSNIVQMS